MAAQITLLKSLLMPEFARELYVGRGLRLPEYKQIIFNYRIDKTKGTKGIIKSW